MISISYLVREPYTGERTRQEMVVKEGESVDAAKEALRATGAEAIKIKITDGTGSEVDRRI